MMLLKTRMLRNLAILSILSSCAHDPVVPMSFDGEWTFYDSVEGERMACLNKEDAKKLARLLIKCGTLGE